MRLAAFAAVLLVGASALAEDKECKVEWEDKYPDSSLPLVYTTPRHVEAAIDFRYLGDSHPVQSAFASSLLLGYITADHWVRVGARAGVAGGAWGEDNRGPVAFDAGAHLAVDVARLVSGLFAVHIPINADFLVGAKNGDAIMRFTAAGIGVNVARIGSLDLMFDLAASLGTQQFSNGWPLAPGFSVALTVDFCGLLPCAAKEQQLVETDVTNELYSFIEDGLRTTPPAVPHGELCEAVSEALDFKKHYPHDGVDATRVFLEAVRAHFAENSSSWQWLDKLVKKHIALRKKLLTDRARVRDLKRDDKAVRNTCTYAPYPVEIRTKFNCDP